MRANSQVDIVCCYLVRCDEATLQVISEGKTAPNLGCRLGPRAFRPQKTVYEQGNINGIVWDVALPVWRLKPIASEAWLAWQKMTGSPYRAAGHWQYLLPRHRDADGVLRRDHVIRVGRIVGDREQHALDLAVEGVALRAVLRGDRSAGVLADVAAVVGGEDHRQRGADLSLAGLLAVDVERRLAALAQAAAGVGELHAHLVLARRDRPVRNRR